MKKLFTEKQLRYIAKATLQDIKGLNPYEKKNVFKKGQCKINHLVFGRQFWDDPLFENWNHVSYMTPSVSKLNSKEYAITFIGGFYYNPNYDKKPYTVYFKKDITDEELYILLAELQDKLEEKYYNLQTV